MQSVGNFELTLIRSGVKLLKYYLDISRAEQKRAPGEWKNDPLAQWTTSLASTIFDGEQTFGSSGSRVGELKG